MKKICRFAVMIVFSLVVAFSFCSCDMTELQVEGITSYVIDMVLDDENKTIDCSESINYTNNYEIELDNICFHLYAAAYREGAVYCPITDSELASAYPNGVNYGGIEIESVILNGGEASYEIAGEDSDILQVNLDDVLIPGFSVDIEIEFTLTVPNVRHRFGYSGETINLGNFYPIVCMYDGGWVCDPYYSNGDPFYSDVANYTVTMQADEKYTVATSGENITETMDDGTIKTSASLLSGRDFALVLGEFETVMQMEGDIEIYYYYYDDEEFEDSLTTACDSISTFNDLFGSYPYPSYSVVQTAFLNGGMEYTGLVYISDEVSGDTYDEVIIHETAHQWWYGVVGNDQVGQAWVDEALAEFSTTLFYDANPSYNATYEERIADATAAYAMYCDLYENTANFSTAIDRPSNEFSSSLEYTYMTYVKTQIMYDSLRTIIGESTFINALANYYAQNKYQIATGDLLIAAFENASESQLFSFFESWLDGKTQTFG